MSRIVWSTMIILLFLNAAGMAIQAARAGEYYIAAAAAVAFPFCWLVYRSLSRLRTLAEAPDGILIGGPKGSTLVPWVEIERVGKTFLLDLNKTHLTSLWTTNGDEFRFFATKIHEQVIRELVEQNR